VSGARDRPQRPSELDRNTGLAGEAFMQSRRRLPSNEVFSLCLLLASICARAGFAEDASQSVWPTRGSQNAQTFVIDAPVAGHGEQRKIILTFNGNKLNLRRTVAVGEGWDTSVDGEQSD
jgi:hypothetical protein